MAVHVDRVDHWTGQDEKRLAGPVDRVDQIVSPELEGAALRRQAWQTLDAGQIGQRDFDALLGTVDGMCPRPNLAPYSLAAMQRAFQRWQHRSRRAEPRLPLEPGEVLWLDMKVEILAAFVKLTGWRETMSSTSLRHVAQGNRKGGTNWRDNVRDLVDHAHWFTFDRRPIACVSHSYSPWTTLRRAPELGLRATYLWPEWQWHFPGHEIAVVFTSLANADVLDVLRQLSPEPIAAAEVPA